MNNTEVRCVIIQLTNSTLDRDSRLMKKVGSLYKNTKIYSEESFDLRHRTWSLLLHPVLEVQYSHNQVIIVTR